MPKELIYIRLFQMLIVANTILFSFGILMAVKGKIQLHQRINSIAFWTTCAGAVGLVFTALSGWDYSQLTSSFRLSVHRSFSTPLLFTLCATVYFGWRKNRKWHMRFMKLTLPLWIGTLITGLWFFGKIPDYETNIASDLIYNHQSESKQ